MSSDARDEPDESQDAWEIIDDTDADEEAERDAQARAAIEARRQAEQEHLNQRHIKAVALEKRALIRSRTYMLVIAFACVVGAGQLSFYAVDEYRAGQTARLAAYVVIAVGLLIVSTHFFRRAHWYQVESRKSVIPPPETTPDFTPLSDGSQFAQNLDHIER